MKLFKHYWSALWERGVHPFNFAVCLSVAFTTGATLTEHKWIGAGINVVVLLWQGLYASHNNWLAKDEKADLAREAREHQSVTETGST